MSIDDFDGDFSDSETDEALLRDIQALSTACTAPPTEKTDVLVSNSSSDGGCSGGVNGEWSSDSEDEFELLRNIQRSYGDGSGYDINRPMSLKPLNTLPPISSDDDEDDFETLLAIQRRFSQYCGGGGDTRGLQSSSKKVRSRGVGISSTGGVLDRQLVREIDANKVGGHCNQEAEAPGNNLSGDGAGCSFEFDQSEDHSSCELQLQKPTLPKSALAFVDAIKKNRSCQKFLRSKIIHAEARIEEVEQLKRRVKVLKDFQVQCKKIIGRVLSNKDDVRVQLISASKHRANSKDPSKKVSAMSDGPLENSHACKYREALARFPQSMERERWLPKEREELKKGILQQFQKLLFLCSTNDESLYMAPQHGNNVDQMMSSIRDVEITPAKMRMILPKVDWEQLASMYVPRHSGAECEARWLNFEDPLLSFASWTTLDDKKLLRTVEQKGIHNWIDIAVSLQTNRTPFQCLARYQRSLNASIIKSSWTADEDDLLRSAVDDFGESNWQAVASAMEGRTGTQCSNRWKKAIHPTIEKKGHWARDEDMRMKIGMAIIGPKWHKIAKFVPGRTQAQCRDRWVNILDPSVKTGEWTADEDLKLRAAIEEHGYRWSRVAACLRSRTDCQCRMRWKELFPREALLLQAARDIQKTALISNFVDRESLRPNLGPKDFLALPPPDVNAQPKRRRTRERKHSNKISMEATFCNIPKKARSKRRRRIYGSGEVPGCAGTKFKESFQVIGEDDTSVSDVYEEDHTLLSRRERRAKLCLKRKRDGEVLLSQSLCSGSRLLTDSVEDGNGNDLAEITQAEATSGDVGLRSTGTDRASPCIRNKAPLSKKKRFSGRRQRTNASQTDESESESDVWVHSTLAELFGEIVTRIKKKKIHHGITSSNAATGRCI
ncbi:hypothetical protein Dimus_004861 [Dionaea muscipula]